MTHEEASKVECPSCQEKYSTAGMPDGFTFRCRKCGAEISLSSKEGHFSLINCGDSFLVEDKAGGATGAAPRKDIEKERTAPGDDDGLSLGEAKKPEKMSWKESPASDDKPAPAAPRKVARQAEPVAAGMPKWHDLAGATIGSFVVREKIADLPGAGLYAAVNLANQMPYTLKAIPSEALDRGRKDAILKRAEIAAGIDHPNVLKLDEFGAGEDFLYFAYPRVAGDTLAEVIEKKGQLEPDEAFRIALKIARALIAIEQNKIAHLELKPANVLTATDGTMMLMGLGSAAGISPNEFASRFSPEIEHMWSYLAPEQIQGAGSVGIEVDVYALGAILFEMLTGQPPFRGRTAFDIMQQHLNVLPPTICDLFENLNPATDTLLFKMLAKSPEERFANAAELYDAIDAVKSGRDFTAENDLGLEHVSISGLGNANPTEQVELDLDIGVEAPAEDVATPEKAAPSPRGAQPPGSATAAPGQKTAALPLDAKKRKILIAAGAAALVVAVLVVVAAITAKDTTPVSPSAAPTIAPDATPKPDPQKKFDEFDRTVAVLAPAFQKNWVPENAAIEFDTGGLNVVPGGDTAAFVRFTGGEFSGFELRGTFVVPEASRAKTGIFFGRRNDDYLAVLFTDNRFVLVSSKNLARPIWQGREIDHPASGASPVEFALTVSGKKIALSNAGKPCFDVNLFSEPAAGELGILAVGGDADEIRFKSITLSRIAETPPTRTAPPSGEWRNLLETEWANARSDRNVWSMEGGRLTVEETPDGAPTRFEILQPLPGPDLAVKCEVLATADMHLGIALGCHTFVFTNTVRKNAIEDIHTGKTTPQNILLPGRVHQIGILNVLGKYAVFLDGVRVADGDLDDFKVARLSLYSGGVSKSFFRNLEIRHIADPDLQKAGERMAVQLAADGEAFIRAHPAVLAVRADDTRRLGETFSEMLKTQTAAGRAVWLGGGEIELFYPWDSVGEINDWRYDPAASELRLYSRRIGFESKAGRETRLRHQLRYRRDFACRYLTTYKHPAGVFLVSAQGATVRVTPAENEIVAYIDDRKIAAAPFAPVKNHTQAVCELEKKESRVVFTSGASRLEFDPGWPPDEVFYFGFHSGGQMDVMATLLSGTVAREANETVVRMWIARHGMDAGEHIESFYTAKSLSERIRWREYVADQMTLELPAHEEGKSVEYVSEKPRQTPVTPAIREQAQKSILPSRRLPENVRSRLEPLLARAICAGKAQIYGQGVVTLTFDFMTTDQARAFAQPGANVSNEELTLADGTVGVLGMNGAPVVFTGPVNASFRLRTKGAFHFRINSRSSDEIETWHDTGFNYLVSADSFYGKNALRMFVTGNDQSAYNEFPFGRVMARHMQGRGLSVNLAETGTVHMHVAKNAAAHCLTVGGEPPIFAHEAAYDGKPWFASLVSDGETKISNFTLTAALDKQFMLKTLAAATKLKETEWEVLWE